MIVSEIRYNQVIERLRFDADYFLPEYLQIDNLLNRFDCVKFEEIIKDINAGKNISQCDEFYKYEKVHFIRTQNIRQILIDKTGLSFVPLKKLSKSRLKKLNEGDLLIVRVGVGISDNVVVFGEFIGSAYSDNTIRIEIDKNKINPFYLSVYLNTKYGKKYWERVQKGSARPLISYENIFEIKIPIPPPSFQQKVESYVKEAYKKRKLADEKYKQAEALLNKILGIEKLELKQEKVFEARFDEIEQTLRFDAEYFLPNYTEILRLLEASGFEIKRLKEISKEVIRRINPLQKPGDKFTYVEIGDIDTSTGTIETKEIFGYEAPPNARKLLKEGDLIISMVRPTRGAITIIPKELNNSIGSTAFYVLNPESPLKEFLFLYLRSSLGLNQLGRPVVGAMYPTLKKEYIEDIIIPNIPERIQTQISELVKQSFELRKESKELLEKAKREVEEFIEKNG